MYEIMSRSSRPALLAAAIVLTLGVVPACKKAEAPQTKAGAPALIAPAAPSSQPTPQPSAAGLPAATASPTAPSPHAAVRLQTQTSPEVKQGETTKCPIMNEEFAVEDDSDFAVWKGKKIYFCCPGKCKKKFDKEPLKYLPAS